MPSSGAPDATGKCQIRKLAAADHYAACTGRAKRRAVLGKDANVAACAASFRAAVDRAGDCRFLDNGDGTVSDLDSGLTWEQKVAGTGCLHCASDAYTWAEAMSTWVSKVNGLANDEGPPHPAGLGGHSDWRIPNELELDGLRDPTTPLCGIEGCLNSILGPSPSRHHWSSITSLSDAGDALTVAFAHAGGLEIYTLDKTESHFVRAVRGTFVAP